MSAPSFGDRVKLKVPTMPSSLETGQPHEPGEIGLVIALYANTEAGLPSLVEVVFEGEHRDPARLPFDAVTTDLTWRTPRQASIARAFERVLSKEGVGVQRGRLTRISGLLLDAYDEGLQTFAQDEERRAQREAEAARQAEVVVDAITPEPPHSRACGVTPHEHGPMCSTNCPTCGGKADED